jgi:hypothetical protein
MNQNEFQRPSGYEYGDRSGGVAIESESEAAIPPPRVPVVSRVELDGSGPRREGWWAALFYGVWVMALGFPALAGKFLAGEYSDQFIAGYAFREFGASYLKATGGFPQWNPYLFGGMPFVAAMHGDIFYPTFILRLLIPTDAAMTWSFILHLFLAGLFAFRFLRASGFSYHASLIGGAGYMMSGQLSRWDSGCSHWASGVDGSGHGAFSL